MTEIKKTKDEVVFRGQVFNVTQKTFEREDKTTFDRDIVETPEVVHILPIDENGNLYTINEFRGSIEQNVIGFPAGKMDDGETPEESAKRETEEELGMKVDSIFPVHKNLVTTMGICDEVGHYFFAIVRDFKEDEIRTNFLDEGEDITVTKMTGLEFAEKIAESIKGGQKFGLKTAFLWMMYTFYNKTMSEIK